MNDDHGSEQVNEQKALNKAEPEQQSTEESEKELSAEQLRKQAAVKSDDLLMHVKVQSPYKDYFDGQAFSISAENSTGPFDILPKHHNFISLLKPCQLVVRSAKENGVAPIKINIGGGLMHVKQDEVLVFLDV